MFDIYVSHLLCFFAGIGAAGVLGAVVLAHRDVTALSKAEPEPTPEPVRQVVVGTGISAYLGGMPEVPELPPVDTSWTPWGAGWEGELTGSFPTFELPAKPAAADPVPSPRDRFATAEYPQLAAEKLTLVATWPGHDEYKPLRVEVAA